MNLKNQSKPPMEYDNQDVIMWNCEIGIQDGKSVLGEYLFDTA